MNLSLLDKQSDTQYLFSKRYIYREVEYSSKYFLAPETGKIQRRSLTKNIAGHIVIQIHHLFPSTVCAISQLVAENEKYPSADTIIKTCKANDWILPNNKVSETLWKTCTEAQKLTILLYMSLLQDYYDFFGIELKLKALLSVDDQTMISGFAYNSGLDISGVWKVHGTFKPYHNVNKLHISNGNVVFSWDSTLAKYFVEYTYTVKEAECDESVVTAFCEGYGEIIDGQVVMSMRSIGRTALAQTVPLASTSFAMLSLPLQKDSYGKIARIQFPFDTSISIGLIRLYRK